MQSILRKIINKNVNNRVSSGVSGFDNMVNGGFHQNSINVILADPGCGKSTFCWEFVSQNIESPSLYVSLEQDLNSILRDSVKIGIHGLQSKYEKGNLQFQLAFSESAEITSGEIALRFFMNELPKYLDAIKEASNDFDEGLRIAIDPLTPLLLEIPDVNQQRNAINRIFSSLRKIGTTVVTLEKGFGHSLTMIPQFLADSIIELEYIGLGGLLNRTMKIKKFRGSSHSEKPHPIGFEVGKGLVVYEIDG